MYLSLVTLSEFGQFLQILLWIFLPVFIVSLLVTTYLNYRKKSREAAEEARFMPAFSDISSISPSEISPALRAAILSAADLEDLSGSDTAEPLSVSTDDSSARQHSAQQPSVVDNSDNPYKGLLWMKNKYEQDRELADLKYEQLKSEFWHSEEKYSAVLAEQKTLRDLLGEKDFRIGLLQNQLDDRQSWIDRLNEQAQQDKTRCEELAAKLEQSSQLLFKIHKELDRSRSPEPESLESSGDPGSLPETGGDENSGQPGAEVAAPGETKIVSWMESGPA